VTIYLRVENGRIVDTSFQGQGCAISKASASLMTESIKGKTLEEAEDLFERFHSMITRSTDEPVDELGKLSVYVGVREFPARAQCSSLPWHTLRSAAASSDQAAEDVVSTE